MVKFDAFVFELREVIRNDGTLMLTMRTSHSETTFETGKDSEEYRIMKKKDDRILRNISFSCALLCPISDKSAGTISARETVSPHFRASDSSRARIATLFDRHYSLIYDNQIIRGDFEN